MSSFSHSSNFMKMVIIVEFVLVAYLIYALTKNVYNSYQVDRYIELFETENALIEQENIQKSSDYLYYTSEEYIDKIAKQNLGLVNLGEEVLVLSPSLLNSDFDELENEASFAVKTRAGNVTDWWNFFFGN